MSNDKKIEINPHFFWLDLETTGLDPESDDVVLEVAVEVTNAKLNYVNQYHRVVLHKNLPQMDPVVIEMHTKSGLFEDMKNGPTILPDAVEQDLLDFLAQYEGQLVLCGSTIHFDRRFIRRYWKNVEARLYYRMVDVSSIKLLAKAWWDVQTPKSEPAHRALADVRASIEELRHWRAEVFRKQPASRATVMDQVITRLEQTLLDMSDYHGNVETVTAALTAVAQVRKDRKAGLL